MTIKNNQKKGVHAKFIALLIAGLLALSALSCLLAPKVTNASADMKLSPGDTVMLNSNVSGIKANAVYSIADGRAVFTFKKLQHFRYVLDTIDNLNANVKWSHVYDTALNIITMSVSLTDDYDFYNDLVATLTLISSFPPDPVKEGYVFVGWFIDEALTIQFDPDIHDFDSPFSAFPKFVFALPPAPIKEGYTFTGWFLDSLCTTPYDGRVITEDLALYAGWRINTYTVSFNSLGGSAVSAQTLNYNTVANLTIPTRTGYDFVGWFLTDGTQYVDQPIKADTVLTAKWKIQVFTVTFYVDGEIYKTLDVDYGTSLSTALQKANLSYYNPTTEMGEKIGLATKITGNSSVLLTEMTTNEKVGAFIANNVWILFVAGGIIVILISTLVIIILQKRR